MSSTDVREWARSRGINIKDRGRIPGQVQDQYDAEHEPVPGPGGEYDESVSADDFITADPVPAEPAPAAPAETRPRDTRKPAGRRGIFAGRGKSKPKPGRKTALPRVSVAGLIEDMWGQLAFASAPLPPMQRLLQAQAPFAGVALEDAIQGTVVDRALQPIARAEEKAKAVGGLLMPPAALMLVLATAPVPTQVQTPEGVQWMVPEADTRHKAALISLRWSLMLMAEGMNVHLDQAIERAAASQERGRQADEFMAWILGMDEPPGDQPTGEDEAIRRAQMLLGNDGNGPG